MGCTIASFTHPKDSYADKRSETIRSISKMGRQVDWLENIGRGITIIPKRRGKISLKARQRLQAYPNIWHITTNRSTSPDKPWTNIRIKIQEGQKKIVHCSLWMPPTPARFHQRHLSPPSRRSVRYFDVSKLSCPACAAVFNVWNQVSSYIKPKINCRGTRGMVSGLHPGLC